MGNRNTSGDSGATRLQLFKEHSFEYISLLLALFIQQCLVDIGYEKEVRTSLLYRRNYM